ncbi:phosphoglycolate phosphatase [Limnohabitans sp. T6-5]|uniref:phosphoglycolate phosphatase n=1 Tax=Limnohabitans sp. T6-5 TaxID=1100724 RepID=UPI000D380602|nr:phosphoglycolate phosphatase [Limnohabitans sp. T6-5]PUE06428.1 phosphoglycolate phosphatase [Limnohabitans sp. T6-5]
MLSRIQAAIVDLDGTMVDTLGDFEVALNYTMADLDLPPITRAMVERTVGKGSEHLIRSVLAHQLAQAEKTVGACVTVDVLYEPAWQRYQHHYLSCNGQHSDVYPGVMEGLQALKSEGIRLACLTNKPLSFAQPLLQAKGLAGFFDQVFGGDSFERKKPDPLPILKTCEALDTTVASTLMVGDSSNDAQAAHAAACPVVLVTYGYNHGRPVQETPAVAWLDSLAHLPDWLKASRG